MSKTLNTLNNNTRRPNIQSDDGLAFNADLMGFLNINFIVANNIRKELQQDLSHNPYAQEFIIKSVRRIVGKHHILTFDYHADTSPIWHVHSLLYFDDTFEHRIIE